MTQQPSFNLITQEQVFALRDLCDTINDWATKKGWNEDPLAGLDIPPKVRDRIERALKMEQHMLFVTEIGESAESIRLNPHLVRCKCGGITEDITGKGPYLTSDVYITHCHKCNTEFQTSEPWPREAAVMDDKVPELTAEAAELADTIIRIFHYCGKRGIDLGQAVMLKHEYNISRPHKHGKNC